MMNIIEAMTTRRSVRTYSDVPLSTDTLQALHEAIINSTDPFGGRVTILLKAFDLKAGYRPSTYGMIKGASNFFLLGMGSDEESALSAGFRFEQVVLQAWQMGLGTCWIAATFKGTDFDRDESWPDDQTLKIVCPVGIPATQRLLEKLGRLTMGSNRRKPFAELFFSNNFNTPLSPDSQFSQSLEMLRLAPSSTNSQPWRVIVDSDTVHFYYKPKSSVSVLDCGIGMCHFYLTEKYLGRQGHFFKSPAPPTPPSDLRYLYSYQIQ